MSSENFTQMETTFTTLQAGSCSSLASTTYDFPDLTYLLSSFPVVSTLGIPNLEEQRPLGSYANNISPTIPHIEESAFRDLQEDDSDAPAEVDSDQPLFSVNRRGSSSNLNLHTHFRLPDPAVVYPTKPYQDPEHLEVLNPILSASHNFESVGSPSLPPVSPTISPRLTKRIYVNNPTLPTRLPHEVNADFIESSQARSSHPQGASISTNTPSVSASSLQLPTISSLSLSSRICPDCNLFSSYTIIGTPSRKTYGQVVLARFLGDQTRQLRTMKIVPKKQFREQNVERELDVLKWLSEVGEQSLENQKDGFNFLQRMMTSFHNENTVFILLDYHPVSLAHPEIASRLHLQHPIGFVDSASSLASTRSIAARVRAIRLLAAELVLGLLFLHEHGIVHQDIKPDNVMISSTGHAVIGEFRAASMLPLISCDDELPALRSNLSVDAVGPMTCKFIIKQPTEVVTSLYAAPELFEPTSDGVIVYDERVDFWSLGALLHEVALGCLPFDPEATDGSGSCGEGYTGVSQTLAIAKSVDEGWDMHLEDLVKQLLIYDYRARLCGSTIKNHSFFDQITEIWHDIASLKHPPLPNPVSSQMVDNVSLHSDDQVTESRSLVRDRDLNTVMGLTGETKTQSLREEILGLDRGDGKALEKGKMSSTLPNRRSPAHSASAYPHNIADNQNLVPDYIIPWINDSDDMLCEDCVSSIRATETDNNSYLEDKFCDSGLVIAEDIPPSHQFSGRLDEHYSHGSPNSSRSSSISTPKSPSIMSESANVDKELLLAAQSYRQLEALLSSGSYFTEPRGQGHTVDEPANDDKEVPWQQDRRLSNVSAISGGIHDTTHSVVANSVRSSRPPSLELPKREDVAKWPSFEHEITVAVLNAMDQRSPHLDHEFGSMSSGAKRDHNSLKRTSYSMKKTFEKFRRKLGSP